MGKQNCKRLKTLLQAGSAILIILLASLVSGKEISLSGGVDKSDIPFEDSVTFTVEIKWQGDITKYSFEVLPLPETENLQVSGTSSTISSSEEAGIEMTTRLFKYNLKPTASGVGIIEPLVLSYVTWPDSIPGELATQQFKILIAEPLPPPESSGFSIVLPVALLALIVVAAAIVLYVRKRKAGAAPPQKTAVETFLEGLEGVKKEAGPDRKVFFTRLYKLLLSFMENEYELETAGKTTQLILEEFEALEIPIDRKEEVVGWLTQAEKEKFAPGTGSPGDVLRLTGEIESFFQKINISDRSEAK